MFENIKPEEKIQILKKLHPAKGLPSGVNISSLKKEEKTKLCEDAFTDFRNYIEYFGAGGMRTAGKRGFFIERGIKDSKWTTLRHCPPYMKFAEHLNHEIWIGLRAPFYPKFCVLDIDAPGNDLAARIQRIQTGLGLQDNQFEVFSSPSFFKTGSAHTSSVHFYLRPLYNGVPPTIRLLLDVLGPRIERLSESLGCLSPIELFPQQRQAFRLPFGKSQLLIDKKTGWIMQISHWQSLLHTFEAIQPIRLENYLEPITKAFHLNNRPLLINPQKDEAERLLRTGLTAHGTRHDSAGILARYCFFKNISVTDAKKLIMNFFRRKHNGMSKEINRENWILVESDVSNWVRDTYSHFGKQSVLPPSHTDEKGWVTVEDMKMITSKFHGDYINQKRLFKLILYYRSHYSNGNARIHSKQWNQIIGKRGVSEFKQILLSRGLAKCERSYSSGNYSMAWKLKDVKFKSKSPVLCDDADQPIIDYKTALYVMFKTSGDIRKACGVAPSTLTTKHTKCG